MAIYSTTVTDVRYADSGRRRALSHYVYDKPIIYSEFLKFRYTLGHSENIRQVDHTLVDDMWQFIKTLNVRIVSEKPRLVEEDGIYRVCVDYEIEEL